MRSRQHYLISDAPSEPRLPPEIFKQLMFRHSFIKSFMDVRNFADLGAVPDQPLAEA